MPATRLHEPSISPPRHVADGRGVHAGCFAAPRIRDRQDNCFRGMIGRSENTSASTGNGPNGSCGCSASRRCARSDDETSCPRPEYLPVFAVEYGDYETRSWLCQRHHPHPTAAWLPVSDNGHGPPKADANKVFPLKSPLIRTSPLRRTQNKGTSNVTEPVNRLVAARDPWYGSRGPPPNSATP